METAISAKLLLYAAITKCFDIILRLKKIQMQSLFIKRVVQVSVATLFEKRMLLM